MMDVSFFFNINEVMSGWVGHQENQVLAKGLELLASHSHPLTAHLYVGEGTAKHGVQCDKISFCGLVSAALKNKTKLLFTFWPCCTACRILVPWSGIEPLPPAVEAWSLDH